MHSVPRGFDFPGNERAIELFVKVLHESRSLAWIGAGAAADLYPTWSQLLHILSQEAISRGLATHQHARNWDELRATSPHEAADLIRDSMGPGLFSSILRETFRPRKGFSDTYYTPLQGLVIRLPFRGYLTTNYDPGLIEARLELRQDSRATGFATWADSDPLHRWLTGDIFAEQPCPILFAHGIYERAETIILGQKDYQRGYSNQLFRLFLDKAWSQESLVFFGTGFADIWMERIADRVLSEARQREGFAPRHLAFVSAPPDQPYSPKWRRHYQDRLAIEPIFYRSTSGDNRENRHHALQRFLEGLCPARTRTPTHSKLRATASLDAHWCHQTTDDELFVEDPALFRKLSSWYQDPDVSLVTVVGLGGVGKTSFVSRWAKSVGPRRAGTDTSLFFWSFYSDRNVVSFLASFWGFMHSRHPKIEVPNELGDPRSIEALGDLLASRCVLVILDGLEVIQERPGSSSYGSLMLPELRDLIRCAAAGSGGSIFVLTSRFPFRDFSELAGKSLRNLDMPPLSPERGSELLQRCGLPGTDSSRANISRAYGGHPLALRVFSLAFELTGEGDPIKMLESLEGPDLQLAGIAGRLSRLLRFYERALPWRQSLVLGVVALFRSPEESRTIEVLSEQIASRRDDRSLTREEVQKTLSQLIEERLLLGTSTSSDCRHSPGD